MDGEKLRAILVADEDYDSAAMHLTELSEEELSEVLSHLLTHFEFNSWKYAVVSEACERLLSFGSQRE